MAIQEKVFVSYHTHFPNLLSISQYEKKTKNSIEKLEKMKK